MNALTVTGDVRPNENEIDCGFKTTVQLKKIVFII